MPDPKVTKVDKLDGDTLCLVDGLEVRTLGVDVSATGAVWDELARAGLPRPRCLWATVRSARRWHQVIVVTAAWISWRTPSQRSPRSFE